MADPAGGELWAALAASPLFGLTATLLAYILAHRLATACGGHPLANPVVTAVALLIALLWLGGIDYATYFDGARFIHFLLGPATVAMAFPLYRQLPRLRRMLGPLALTLLAGVLINLLSVLAIARWLGASEATRLSLAPKSVTTPVAMGIAAEIGGIPSLTAVFVVVTGIFGAVVGQWVFTLLRVEDPAARGFAMGLAAHGIGTARAFQVDVAMGAFSGLALALAALLTAALLPALVG